MPISEIKYNLSNPANDNICEGMRERSNTFPRSGVDMSYIRNSHRDIHHNVQSKEHYKKIINDADKTIIVDAKICQWQTTDESAISSRHFVPLTCCKSALKMYKSASLDKMGNLVVIDGQCNDLFVGLYKNKFGKKKYQCYTVDLGNDFAFDDLRINEKGMLIVRLKGTSKEYLIDTAENSKHLSFIYDKETIKFILTEQETQTAQDSVTDQRITLEIEGNKSVVFKFEKNSLSSLELKIKDSIYPFDYPLSLPSKNHTLLSAKKTYNCIQLEISNGERIKICYLHPNNIKLDNMGKMRLSHKPPQNLYSFLGASPYEHYESGQPFSSTRIGNFSSKRILMIDGAIDNYRINYKNAKENYYNEDYKKFATSVCKAFDPGVRALTSSMRNFCLSNKLDSTYNEMNNMFEIYTSAFLNTPETNPHNTPPITSLINFFNDLNIGDKFTLTKSSKISAFFGLARVSAPLTPGGFFGLIPGVSKESSVTISKKNDTEIEFSFIKDFAWFIAGLVGTGQGVSKDALTKTDISFLNILLAEINLIFIYHNEEIEELTFTINNEDFVYFMEVSKKNVELNYFIKEKAYNIYRANTKKSNYQLIAEARGPELRAQIGKPYGDGNYLVAPRLTGGLMVSVNLLEGKKEKITNPDTGEEISNKKEIKYLSFSSRTVFENKNMAILPANESLVTPIVINENSDSKNIYSQDKSIKTEGEFIPKWRLGKKRDKTVADLIELLNSIEKTKKITHCIECLTDVDIIIGANNNKKGIFKTHENSIKYATINKRELDELKFIKNKLSESERDSNNKRLYHYFDAQYTLTRECENENEDLEKKVSALKDIALSVNGEECNEWYSKIQSFQKKVKYKISTINIYGTAESSKSLATLTNIVVGVKTTYSAVLQKHLVTAIFNYNNEDTDHLGSCTINIHSL